MGADKGKVIELYGKLVGAQFAFAGMNFMVDPSDLPITGGQCVDICNGDVDYQNNVSRRKGYFCVYPADMNNGWSNGVNTYCTVNSYLCSVTITPTDVFVSSIAGIPPLSGRIEFKQVNDVVMFSDGLIIGILQGDGVTILDKPIFDI